MIPKAELLALAREWQLTPGVVEKDYVLGWMLAGVGADTETAEAWVFKGGTCLKKCVLETYRFSEDLDFTLTPSAKYAEGEIAAALARITAWVAERSGLVFPAGSVAIRARQNRAGERTFEASVGYQGPLSQPGPPKIRFDITQHEPIVTPTVEREIFHPYSDALPERLRVTSYSTAELVAEKTRALFERSRPRDLYDVIQLGEIELPAEETARLRAVAVRKFESKGLNLPSASELESAVRANGELTSWPISFPHFRPWRTSWRVCRARFLGSTRPRPARQRQQHRAAHDHPRSRWQRAIGSSPQGRFEAGAQGPRSRRYGSRPRIGCWLSSPTMGHVGSSNRTRCALRGRGISSSTHGRLVRGPRRQMTFALTRSGR